MLAISVRNLYSITKRSVVLFGPKRSILHFKNIRFLFRKKRYSLKIAVPEFSIFLKSICFLLAIFLKFFFNQKKKRGFIGLKRSVFYFIDSYSEKRGIPWKKVVPKFSIFLKSTEKQLWFYLAQKFWFFISNTFEHSFRKKKLFLENSCSWISKI